MMPTHITGNLTGCETVLDLCAGTGQWLAHFSSHKIAVELNDKYNKSLKKAGYAEIYNVDVKNYEFKPVEATIWIDGIEHLEEKDALEVLEKVEKYTTKKIVIYTPNSFVSNEYNAKHLGEPLQIHKSCFPKEFWLARGYECIRENWVKGEEIFNNLYVKRCDL